MQTKRKTLCTYGIKRTFSTEAIGAATYIYTLIKIYSLRFVCLFIAPYFPVKNCFKVFIGMILQGACEMYQ